MTTSNTLKMDKATATIVMETLISDNNLVGMNLDLMVKSYIYIFNSSKGDNWARNENAKFLILFYSHQYKQYANVA